MEEIPPEEQYETDTIFSQEGDTPESYLQTKLYELESDNEMFSDGETNLKNEQFITIDMPPATPVTNIDSDSFRKLVEESKFVWSKGQEMASDFDKIVFEEDVYDMEQDSFRYGRVTSGTSYNLVTGRMQDQIMEKVKEKYENEDDEIVETVTEDENTHLITTEVTISLNGNSECKKLSAFDELYESQMPKFFKYRDDFPEIRGIWTLLFDQEHYSEMSTFELQASICAALNSKHQLILCVGVDSYNTVTGVEMSATDRVVFRMALTRAVAGEFQPPLIKVPPKQLTGVSPMKRDVSEMISSVDVLFIPVLGDSVASGDCAVPTRFLIVVRVKELTDKLYQLSSGRIYVEENGRVVELSSINEAFHNLITSKSPEQKPSFGSAFMLEPEPFVEDAPLEIDECSSEEDDDIINTREQSKSNVIETAVQEIIIPEEQKEPFSTQISNITESVISHLDTQRAQNIGWLLFATVVAYGIYQSVRTRF